MGRLGRCSFNCEPALRRPLSEMILMYIPHAFRIDLLETLNGFMRQYSFATLITGG